MNEPDGSSALVEKVLAGGNRRLQLLAAQGLLPLARAELIPLQVSLAASADPEIAKTASQTVADTDPEVVARLIDEDAPDEVVRYCARNLHHTAVLQAVLRRRGVSGDLLIELAPRLDADLQEILLLRQDAIVEQPAILDALETNDALSSYAKRRIREYRDHLLPRERSEPKSREELEREADELTDAEVELAIDRAREVEGGEKGEVDEATDLNETQIRSLPVPVRLKLSRGGSPSTRSILLRDPNPMVATSVLRNNPMPDSEIERVAGNRAVVPEVLETISRNRQWTRKYTIVVALARNPRTPVGVALRLLPRLAVRDLQAFTRDRNVANAVRASAQKLYKMKRH